MGSTNRSSSPESVRYVSVTIVVQRLWVPKTCAIWADVLQMGTQRRTDTTWRVFLQAQAATILAANVYCALTLQRLYCFFVLETGSRYVHILCVTANPDGPRAAQQIRNLLMDLGDHATDFRFLIRDRAGQFTTSFNALLPSAGIETVKDPAPEPPPYSNSPCHAVSPEIGRLAPAGKSTSPGSGPRLRASTATYSAQGAVAMPVREAEHPLSHRQSRRAIAQSGDHSSQLVPRDRRRPVTTATIGPGRGPRQLSRDESRRMNLNNDVVYRRFRLGPLRQSHPRRPRSLIRHHDRLHQEPTSLSPVPGGCTMRPARPRERHSAWPWLGLRWTTGSAALRLARSAGCADIEKYSGVSVNRPLNVLAVTRNRRRSWRHRRQAVVAGICAGLIMLAAGVPVTVLAVTASAAGARPATAARAALSIVPRPVSARVGSGHFTLTRRARIVASPGARTAAELAVAADLAAYLRPATGYRLPAVTGAPRPGDIVLEIGRPKALTRGHQAEGYQLTTTTSGARIEAPAAHGLYNGIQTFRQLLPAWISSRSAVSGPWTTPVVTVDRLPSLPLPRPAVRCRPALRAGCGS